MSDLLLVRISCSPPSVSLDLDLMCKNPSPVCAAGGDQTLSTRALAEGKRGGYASAKQNFSRKTGTAAVRDHGITTRRADAAEPSRCRRMRRG
jgi:hypothetical protein